MKKEFLDEIYNLRSKILSDIEILKERQKEPKYKCCDNMQIKDENLIELRTKLDQLYSIDYLISIYIKIHS